MNRLRDGTQPFRVLRRTRAKRLGAADQASPRGAIPILGSARRGARRPGAERTPPDRRSVAGARPRVRTTPPPGQHPAAAGARYHRPPNHRAPPRRPRFGKHTRRTEVGARACSAPRLRDRAPPQPATSVSAPRRRPATAPPTARNRTTDCRPEVWQLRPANRRPDRRSVVGARPRVRTTPPPGSHPAAAGTRYHRPPNHRAPPRRTEVGARACSAPRLRDRAPPQPATSVSAPRRRPATAGCSGSLAFFVCAAGWGASRRFYEYACCAVIAAGTRALLRPQA